MPSSRVSSLLQWPQRVPSGRVLSSLPETPPSLGSYGMKKKHGCRVSPQRPGMVCYFGIPWNTRSQELILIEYQIPNCSARCFWIWTWIQFCQTPRPTALPLSVPSGQTITICWDGSSLPSPNLLHGFLSEALHVSLVGDSSLFPGSPTCLLPTHQSPDLNQPFFVWGRSQRAPFPAGTTITIKVSTASSSLWK